MLRPSLKFLRRNVVPTSLVDGFFNKRSEACFSKVPITFIFLAWKAVLCLLCIQDQTLNNSENNAMKLSENEAILTGLLARNCATIQQVLILKICLRGPKCFRVFRETGRWFTSLSSYCSQLMGWIMAIYNNNNLFINTIQVQRRRKNMRMQETIENELIETI